MVTKIAVGYRPGTFFRAFTDRGGRLYGHPIAANVPFVQKLHVESSD